MHTLPTLYLKGTFNGWGLDTPFVPVSPQQLQACVVLSADRHQFKIADKDGTAEWTFSAHPTQAIELNEAITQPLIATQGIGNDLVYIPQKTERFTLTLDCSQPQPSLTITKGANNAEVEVERAQLHSQLIPTCGPTPNAPHREHALAIDTLFDTLTIEENRRFPFVFGDNVDGYYEGQTHSFVGAGRYRHHQGWYLGGFAAFVDGQLLNKPEACRARLLPYGIEHHYACHSRDRLSVHSGQRQVALSVQSVEPTTLAIVPELNIALNDCQIKTYGQCVLIEINPERVPEGAPRFLALSANQAVEAQEMTFEQCPALDYAVHLDGGNCKLRITTSQPSTLLTLYLCFEHDKDAAIQQAQNAAYQHADLRHQHQLYHFLTDNDFYCDDQEYNRAVMWARLASRTFVSHEFGLGIWAGLPWFKDCWGRDTFIALSGTSLINGLFDEAKAIISNFASMQKSDLDDVNHGRIPNRVTSKTNIIYNTTDGTPWMIREIMEYLHYSGDMAFAQQIYPVVQRFIQGVEKHYLDEDGLMSHRDPDTWMDAKINGQIPWSPRGPKANDIQALWFESLQITEQLALWQGDEAFAQHCHQLATKAQESFVTKFWQPESRCLADCLRHGDEADLSQRPNQLMALTIPMKRNLLAAEIGQHLVKNCVEQLLFPWGICSLTQSHQDFHPYHDNRSEYHKDAAYHNGTIWGWNAGFTVSALCQFGQQDFAYQLSKNLAKQILTQGHRGTMSENLDAFQQDENALVMTGTYAQAWSVSEFARNAQQDYLGFMPRLAEKRMLLHPQLPSRWHKVKARLPFGQHNALLFTVTRQNNTGQSNTLIYSVKPERVEPEVQITLVLELEDTQLHLTFPLNEAHSFIVRDGQLKPLAPEVILTVVDKPHYALLENLSFAQPDWQRKHHALQQQDYLRQKRMADNLALAED
ncbi:TPA: glycogen debranching protein [Vibrio vulnificus]|nr:glycogen debranching protein [Vibrio vulnificus]